MTTQTDISGWQVRLNDELIATHTESGAWRNETIAQTAERIVASEPDFIAHVFEGQAYPLRTQLRQAESLAASLHERGLRPGDVAAFQLPNWAEAAVIDLACAMLGLVVAPIVPIYRDTEVSYMLSDCRAKVAFVCAEFRGFDYLAMMERLAPGLPDLQFVSPVRANPDDPNSYEALTATPNSFNNRPVADANAVKMILYTSGTTGRPKGVLHSHNTMAHTVRRSAEHWGLGEGDTMLMASPVTHITGFGSGLELPMLCRMQTVFMDTWNAAEGVRLIQETGASMSMGATPFLQELLAEAEKRGTDLPSLRVYACGGAAVPPELILRARRQLANCHAFRVFGSSEVPLVTLGFIGNNQDDLAARTDGEVVHFEVRITDDEGNTLPPGAEGEICARGPAMMLGYANPDQTGEAIDEEGYFHTGDLGILTKDNAIVVTGRKKDLINRGGEKISAKEVEDVLHQHPAIAEAAVVAMPHARLGETVCAYVIPKKGDTLSFEELSEHIAQSGIAKQKTPEKLMLVEDFPRTASGKIRKDLLRDDIRLYLSEQSFH